MLPTALRALSLDNKGYRTHRESLLQPQIGQRKIVHTKRFPARLAIEMDMGIGMIADCFTAARFIIQDTTSVFESMHDIVLQEQGQYAEYTGLVHRFQQIFQVGQTHRPARLLECLQYKEPVGCRLYTFQLQPCYQFILFHPVIA